MLLMGNKGAGADRSLPDILYRGQEDLKGQTGSPSEGIPFQMLLWKIISSKVKYCFLHWWHNISQIWYCYT